MLDLETREYADALDEMRSLENTVTQDRRPHPSPFFIDFLAKWLDGSDFSNQTWVDQVAENLVSQKEVRRSHELRLERLSMNETAQSALKRSYKWFDRLLSGDWDSLAELHAKYQFMAIVGAPRSGGSYLTAEIFASLGHDPLSIPSVIAHDGFPEAHPFSSEPVANAWMTTLLTAAEYITMVESFFPAGTSASPTIVPKKLTKAVYSDGFFDLLLGPSASFYFTIRAPIDSCISTYEKSGGLPSGGMFVARSAIEKWIQRDVAHTGSSSEELSQTGYFEAYVKYWEQYHIRLALSGLLSGARRVVVNYGKSEMEDTAGRFHKQFRSDRRPTQFVLSSPGRHRHPSWVKREEEALARVSNVWMLTGAEFPKLVGN